jgi:TM2 domain-containing membrane protein YozV
MPSEEIKNHPGLAAVLSFVFNGLGQIYNGQIIKGLVIIFFSTLSMILTILGAVFMGCWLLGRIKYNSIFISGLVLFVIGIIFICIIAIYSILDAYRVALKK